MREGGAACTMENQRAGMKEGREGERGPLASVRIWVSEVEKCRGAMVAALGGCGPQPSAEALKHVSLSKPAKTDPSARVCEAYSDPC